MLLILVPKVTNRLRYTMQLMLNRLLGLEVEYTCNISDFKHYDGPKFSYGVSVENKFLFFAANSLLFESKITARDLKHYSYEGGIVLFSLMDKDSVLPFDPFAASFYLVSRYEEYLPHIRDSHNRYLASGSDAYQQGYLHKPLVNMWSFRIKDILHSWFPGLTFTTPVYDFVPTIDVDAAYAYKNKGVTRALGGIYRAFQNKDYDEVRH